MARTLTARVTELRSRSGLLDVLWRTVDEARIDGQRRLGAEITYYAFFSLFPLLMVFVTVIEAMFGKTTSEEIVKSVLGQFPVVGSAIVGNIATPQGRGFAAVVGIVLALWAGSHAFESFEHAILVIWKGPGVAPIPYVKSRLWAFILMGILGVAILVTTIVGSLLAPTNRIASARPRRGRRVDVSEVPGSSSWVRSVNTASVLVKNIDAPPLCAKNRTSAGNWPALATNDSGRAEVDTSAAPDTEEAAAGR